VFPLATPRFSSITMPQVIQPTASQDYLCNGDVSPTENADAVNFRLADSPVVIR
jgi:hypothetical protein